jgi:hypothetical protein
VCDGTRTRTGALASVCLYWATPRRQSPVSLSGGSPARTRITLSPQSAGAHAGCYGHRALRTLRWLAVRADRRPAIGTAAGASRYGRGLAVGCAGSQHQNEGGNQGHHHPPNDALWRGVIMAQKHSTRARSGGRSGPERRYRGWERRISGPAGPRGCRSGTGLAQSPSSSFGPYQNTRLSRYDAFS